MAASTAQDAWGLIGLLAVLPSRHRQSTGTALMTEALRRLLATSRGRRWWAPLATKAVSALCPSKRFRHCPSTISSRGEN
nr:hypothetical protein [Brucella ciceri]